VVQVVVVVVSAEALLDVKETMVPCDGVVHPQAVIDMVVVDLHVVILTMMIIMMIMIIVVLVCLIRLLLLLHDTDRIEVAMVVELPLTLRHLHPSITLHHLRRQVIQAARILPHRITEDNLMYISRGVDPCT